METKIFVFLAFCSTFFLQVHDVYTGEAIDIESYLDFGIPADAKLENENAQKTIDSIFETLKSMLTNKRSGKVVRESFTTIRVILTSENGRKQIMTLTKLISFVLRDKNSVTMIDIHGDHILKIAKDEINGGKVTSSLLGFVKSLSAQPNLVPAAEGFVEGLKILLDGVTPAQVQSGIDRMLKLQKISNKLLPTPQSTSVPKRKQSFSDDEDQTELVRQVSIPSASADSRLIRQ